MLVRTSQVRVIATVSAVAAVVAAVLASVAQSAAGASAPIGVYSTTQVPATPSASDPNAVELGLRFKTVAAGQIVGVRFYKGAGNTGVHIGTLWTSAGAKLRSVTFTGEPAGGWQTAMFSAPVPVVAGGQYVTSYQAPKGHYAYQSGAFANGATIGNSSLIGTAGVYAYGSGSFPNQSYNNTAYFVDTLYQKADAPAPTPTTSTASATPTPTTSTPTPTPTTSTPTPTPTPTSTGSPAACAGGGSYLWSNLATCGWPGPRTPAPSRPSVPAACSRRTAVPPHARSR